MPVSSFRDLLRHLATLTLNTVAMPTAKPASGATLYARPTLLQDYAFNLLGVRPST